MHDFSFLSFLCCMRRRSVHLAVSQTFGVQTRRAWACSSCLSSFLCWAHCSGIGSLTLQRGDVIILWMGVYPPILEQVKALVLQRTPLSHQAFL